MKILLSVLTICLLLTACTAKKDTITFDAVIEQIDDRQILVNTTDHDAGFDKANVSLAEGITLPTELTIGQTISVEATPEIGESYPVKVTALKITVQEPSIAEYKRIAPQKAQEMMTGEAIILDVRTQTEFDEGHIPNAILLPDTEIAKKAEEILPDKTKTILIYCRSGRRSATAARELIALGYSNVYDFGGILDWPGELVGGNRTS